MVKAKLVRHRTQRKHKFSDLKISEFVFGTEKYGKIHLDVKNGKISEHPEQRSLDTVSEEVANEICMIALVSHAHFNERYQFSAYTEFDGLK